MYYQFYDILWKNTRVFFLIMQTHPPPQKKTLDEPVSNPKEIPKST